ncbi:MAG: sulfatase-like hydrolase/transferase [Pseudomonadota bacterium]
MRLVTLLLTLLCAAPPAEAVEGTHYRVERWVLDHLADATFTPALPDEYKGPRSPQLIQEMWHGDPAGRRHPWRRRVVLRERARALRDMRDALLLPAGTSATLPQPGCPGGRLVFTAVALHGTTGERPVEVTLRRGDHELWRHTLTGQRVDRSGVWPPETILPIGDGDAPLILTVGGETDKDVLAWANPRQECPLSEGATRPLNVIYVVVDALRSDVVGGNRRWGGPSISPNIDRLEASGATFPRGFSNGNTTLLSMNTMLLGAHPRAVGFLTTWWAKVDRRPLFYARRPPYLTRLLRSHGSLTWGATHDHLYFPGYKWGVDPGFDGLQDSGRDPEDATILTDLSIEFMEAHRDRPFLLELNLLAPHQPYKAPKEVLQGVTAALAGVEDLPAPLGYLAEVAWADLHVGKLLDALDRLGLRERTLVILTADHGEIFDRAHACKDWVSGKSCHQSHGLTWYDEEINVPIMLSLPGVIPAGSVREDIAQHVDLAPTVLDLLGVPAPGAMTGRSLAAALKGGPRLPDVPVYAESWVSRIWRTRDWKLILHTRKDTICPTVARDVCNKSGRWFELFDLRTDPRERKDVSKGHPEIVEEFSKKIEAFRMELYQKSGGEGPNP